jgi:hypothetical protein
VRGMSDMSRVTGRACEKIAPNVAKPIYVLSKHF